MDKTFNASFEFNKSTIIGDVGYSACELSATRILNVDAFPWISFELLHAKGDTLSFGVKADNLNFNCLTNLKSFRRMVDTLPSNVSNVQETVNAAEVNASSPPSRLCYWSPSLEWLEP